MPARNAVRTTLRRLLLAVVSLVLIATEVSLVASSASADTTTTTPVVIDIPALPADAVNDPCGPGNAVWNDLVDDTGMVNYTKPDGHLAATIVPADTVFTDNTTTHDYGLAPDSNVACPTPEPTIVSVPAKPTVSDKCGPNNAAWNVPGNSDMFIYTLRGDKHLVVTINPAHVTFTGGSTTHDYGLAPDSNVACPTHEPLRSPLPRLPHTRAQAYNTCMYHTDIVQHQGTHNRRGPDVDTAAWIMRALTRSSRVELDLQVANTSSDVFEGFFYHDSSLSAGTRNGSGPLYQHGKSYLASRITNHGQYLGQYRWFLSYLAAHPTRKAQLEHKNYFGQFTAKRVRQAYALQVAYGVQHRIKDSSHWVSVLRTLEAIDHSIYTEQIAFFNDQPELGAILKYGIDQANMTYKAAFRPYGHYRTFLAAARAHGVHTLVRSQPSGAGDSGYWWSREIKAGAQTLVVQNKSRSQVCGAVRRSW